jgi:ABC-type cobalamin/Fe3+-siderophores transport system ATPase subunit
MTLDDLVAQKKFTVLLGKNGAGKSTALRAFAQRNRTARYISPERGGVLLYEPNIDQSIAGNERWLDDSRMRNRSENFRQQSAVQFRNLELLTLREIERDLQKRRDVDYTFDAVIADLSEHLPAIRLARSDRGFEITSVDGQRVNENEISSGESEFIALAIEVLVYSRSQSENKMLLLDEPDVHLHPDLQARFVHFVEQVAATVDMRVVIATHSTAIIGAFDPDTDLQIVPVSSRGQTDFTAFERTTMTQELLPVFGAHPLSSMFNRTPILLVEGEDDRRVVDQVVRSSNGRVRLSPCVVGSKDEMGQWEAWLEQFLPVIYDTPIAYSLRDLDDGEISEINDLNVVRRSRLNCYAMENLLVSDESLAAAGITTEDLLHRLGAWLAAQIDHKYCDDIRALIEQFELRRKIRLKNVRNILLAVLGISKPWEVHVGQVLAGQGWQDNEAQNSLRVYLGAKAAALFA